MYRRSYGNTLERLRIAVLSKHDLSTLGPGDKLHTHDKIMALAKQTQVILFTPYNYASGDMQSHMKIIQFSPPGPRFALTLTVALFAHRKDYDCIYARDPLLIALAVPLKAFGKAMIIEMNGIPSLETEIRRRTRKVRAPSLTPLICGLMRMAETIAIRSADMVLPVTKKMRMTIIRDYKANPRRVIVVPNSVDTTVFRPLEDKRVEIRSALGIEGETVVLYLGTFSDRWRGSEQLFQIAEAIQRKRTDVVFLVVGSGPLLAEMKVKAKSVNSNKVLFVGAVDHRNVPLYINAADMYVYDAIQVPTRLVEKQGSCPTKILEAMSCGRPVIAPGLPDLEDILRESKGAFSVSSVNEVELSIERLANAPELARSMGAEARRYVKLTHDLTRLTRSTVDLISEVLSSREVKPGG